MQWKREKYGGIQSIRVPPSQVWTPDVNTDSLKCAVSIGRTLLFRSFYSIMPMENTRCHLNPTLLFITTGTWIGFHQRSINQVVTSMWNSFHSVNHFVGMDTFIVCLSSRSTNLRVTIRLVDLRSTTDEFLLLWWNRTTSDHQRLRGEWLVGSDGWPNVHSTIVVYSFGQCR